MEQNGGFEKHPYLNSANPYFPQKWCFFFGVFWRLIDPRPADGE